MRNGLAILGFSVLAAGLGHAAPAEAASFNCARASSPAEMAICNSPGLGEMDQQMAQLYFGLTNDAPGWAVRQIKSEQSAWLSRRNRCGYDNVCLGNAYQRRIGQLEGWQARVGY